MSWGIPRGRRSCHVQAQLCPKSGQLTPTRTPGKGLINTLSLYTRRHPAPESRTLSLPIRKLGPAFMESCRFHQEVQRSSLKGPWTLPLAISQRPASLGRGHSVVLDPQLWVYCPIFPGGFLQAKCIFYCLPSFPNYLWW